jgi:hypothetical protein
MNGQLDRVHTLLAAGNVPCEMKRRTDGRPVLVAGTPTAAKWDVLVWAADGQLWVQHKGAVQQLPTGTDQAVADAIKFRVVQSWADQGDPQAKALLSAIDTRYPSTPSAGPRESASPGYIRPAGSTQPAMRSVTAQISPWGFALRVTDRGPGDSIPTSWAWQWGLGANPVTDFYQRFFTEFRKGLLGAPSDENP